MFHESPMYIFTPRGGLSGAPDLDLWRQKNECVNMPICVLCNSRYWSWFVPDHYLHDMSKVTSYQNLLGYYTNCSTLQHLSGTPYPDQYTTYSLTTLPKCILRTSTDREHDVTAWFGCMALWDVSWRRRDTTMVWLFDWTSFWSRDFSWWSIVRRRLLLIKGPAHHVW